MSFCNVALKFIMNLRNMEKKSNSNLFKDMKSMSKTRFSHYLLSYNCLPVQSKELRAKF